MSMSRKDYELIAGVLRDVEKMMREDPHGAPDPWVIPQMFAEKLAEGNPRFDTAKFVLACRAD